MATKNTKTKNTSKATGDKGLSKGELAAVASGERATKEKTATNVASGYDVLEGRVGTRTNAIHRVLIEAAKKGERLKSSVIGERAAKLLGPAHPSYVKLAAGNTVGPHMNTMKIRGYVDNDGTGYALTSTARKLAGLKAASGK